MPGHRGQGAAGQSSIRTIGLFWRDSAQSAVVSLPMASSASTTSTQRPPGACLPALSAKVHSSGDSAVATGS